MDFVLSNAPARITVMTRPIAWDALNLGHNIFEEQSIFEDGQWHTCLQNPELSTLNPFVYGHTGLTSAVFHGNAPKSWKVAWNPESFDTENCYRKYDKLMWNQNIKFMLLAEALDSWPTGGWHMRPCGADSGPKAFKGFACKKEDLLVEWAKARQGVEKRQNLRVACSALNLPFEEYRLVFMQNKYIDGSLYLRNGKLELSRCVPENVIAFARLVAEEDTPSTHCVIDVGVSEDGRLGVIEFNSLHSSGLYATDRIKIINGISDTWC